MKQYPLEINFSDFNKTLPLPPRKIPPSIYVTRSVLDKNIQNAVGSQNCGPVEVWLTNLNTNSRSPESGSRKSSDTPSHPLIASNSDSRYCFAPLQEEIWIRWKHKNPDLIKQSKLELFCRIGGELKKIWTKTFTWDKCPENAKTQFKGSLKLVNQETDIKNNPGLQSVTLDYQTATFDPLFPDGCVTAEFSPYQLKLTVVPKADNIKSYPQSVWIYFDVRVKLELFWGDEKMIPAQRGDGGMPTTRKQVIVAEEKAILNALRHNDRAQGFQIDTANREIIIDADIFKEGHADAFHNDFVETTKLWGEGPRIPVIAEIKVKKSDGTFDLCPPAAGNAKFLWDWEDTDDTQTNPKWNNWVDATATQETRDFLGSIFDAARDLTDPLDSDNCPTSYGGKRAKTLHPFPLQSGYVPADMIRDGAFPFAVTACQQRRWAVFSKAWRTGALAGKTGVLFQPSRIAGDKYKLSVYLYYDSALDTTAKAGTFRAKAGDAHAATGFWEVFRRVHLTYIKRAGATAIQLGPIKNLYKKELGMILEDVSEPLDEARYKNALIENFKKFNEDSQRVYNNPILPLCLRYAFKDPNFQRTTSPAVELRSRDDFKQAVEEAFQDNQVFGLEVSTANSFILEEIESNTGVKAIVVAKHNNLLLVLADRGGTFQLRNTVTGIASKTVGTITAVHVGLWEKQIKEELHPKDREVKVVSGTETTTISWTPLMSRLGDGDKKKLKTFLTNVANQAANDETVEIKVQGKYNDKTNRERRDYVKDYLNRLFAEYFVIEKKSLLAKIEQDSNIYQKYHPTNPSDRSGKTYDWGVTLLMQDGFKEYLDTTPAYRNRKGVYFFHLPGRDDLFKVKIAGASFPDSSKREKAIVYITTMDAGYMTHRVESDNSVIDYKNNNAVSAHEIAHALFIPHAKWKTGRQLKPPPFEPGQHVPGDNCIMNYDMDSDHFCGFCMLRLRGWDWKTMKTDFAFAVPEIRLVAGVGGKSKVYSEDYEGKNAAPTDGRDDFHFAPEQETVNIEYKIKDPKSLIEEAKIELLRKSDRKVLWTKNLQPNDFSDGSHTLPWDGKTVVNPDFPDEYITIEHSPYIMEISVKGRGWGEPEKAWTNFEVQVDSINLEWGPKTVLAQSAAQGTTAAQLGVVTGLERDHQVWEYLNGNEVLAPYNYLGATGEPNLTNQLPKPGETKKIFLVSNNFYTNDAEQRTNATFDLHRASWTSAGGYGPNIPIFARVLIKAINDTGINAPLALGNAKFLWDWTDTTEPVELDPEIDAVAVDVAVNNALIDEARTALPPRDLRTQPWSDNKKRDVRTRIEEEFKTAASGGRSEGLRKYLVNTMDYFSATTTPPGLGCHVDRGGKRGAVGCAVFPAQANPGTDNPAARVFPFEVSHTTLVTRTWSAVSLPQKTGTYAGCSGVIFQPAPVAGDSSALSVCLYFPQEFAQVDVVDTDNPDDPKNRLPKNRVALTGNWEVWRELHVPRYYKKKAAQIGGAGALKDFDFALIKRKFQFAYIRLRVPAPVGMAQADFDRILNQIVANGVNPVPPPNALPAFIARAVAPNNWALGDFLLGFKTHAQWTLALNAAAPPIRPPNYFDNLLPAGVLDPYNPLNSVWNVAAYNQPAPYETLCKLDWGRQILVRLLDDYAVDEIGANPPDGIYILQGNEMTNFGSGSNAFGIHFLPAHRNRGCFIFFRENTSDPVFENTIVHELGHNLFMAHCHDRKQDPWKFHQSPYGICIMSYQFTTRNTFCGACLLRLRGWSLYNVIPGGGTQENPAPVRATDTGRTLFPGAEDNKRAVGDLVPPPVTEEIYT